MCVSLILGLAGVAASAAGTVMSAQASEKQADIEERKMSLEADRHRRSAYREMIRNQAQSETAGAAAGALGGSGVMGGLAQAANSGQQSIRDTNQNEVLGHASADASRQAAQGQMLNGIGGGISSLGSAFVKNQDAITRIGRTATGKGNKWASIWDTTP